MRDDPTEFWRELCAEQREAAISAIEDAYRGGYMRGYFAAVDDVEALKENGISRLSEAYNVMADHAAKPIVQWRYDEDAVAVGQSDPAPKLDVPNWYELRRQVFARDGRRCSAPRCRATRELEIDHVKSVAEGGLPTLDNLRVLCKTCNRARPRQRWVAR